MNKQTILWMAGVAGLTVLGGAFLSLAPGVSMAQAKAVTKYQCPMHPQIVRDEPGDCPICHMTLQKVELGEEHDHAHDAASREAHGAPSKAAKPKRWRHPHDPTRFSDKPAKDEHGMDYVPVEEEEAAPQPAAGAGVPGKASFSLPAERQQLIGVRVAKAEKRVLAKVLRLAGRVSGAGALAQLLEMDAGLVRPGQKAVLVGPGGQEVAAQVEGVEGGLDPYTRSFGVLLGVASRPGWMRSGVYCEARVEVELGRKLAVPEEAVLDTGEQQVAFVRLNGTRFEPRRVRTGAAGQGWVQVLEGVKEGEEVVVSANFLIDSEARFKAALAQYSQETQP